ncbi:MAG: RDD family protein [Candidatus Lumbricidophila eiseniae]|uniref:RDD family protein n=1 Tax=Candidatus Lumbricidiphila eiseniae TaxID=1969409 RepID=A0A2A6FRE2_9MICO|nr:MAG: RDD family protein [Candidatus Lumbricidophila eiseniae]
MSHANPHRFGDLAPSKWPGERLGLPSTGRGSIARVGRRIVALLVDWGSAMLLALLLTPYNSVAYTWVTPLVFLVLQLVFIPTIGGSVGHRLFGMSVVPLVGGWVGVRRSAVRSILLALVLPALVWDSDQRGFHDKVAGTALIRR